MKTLFLPLKLARTVSSLFKLNLYAEDLLISRANHDFVNEKPFQVAYEKAMFNVPQELRPPGIRWRIRTALWAADQTIDLQGDFIECGVNYGCTSIAVLSYLGHRWNGSDKKFLLFDTFDGVPEDQFTKEEARLGAVEENRRNLASGEYTTKYSEAIKMFGYYPRTHVIRGKVPECLPTYSTPLVSYLHLDMNAAVPEVNALQLLWPRLVVGAVVLLDDYGFKERIETKRMMDKLAFDLKFNILPLPTGQGLIVKGYA